LRGLSLDELSLDELSLEVPSRDELAFEELSFDELSFEELSFDEDELSFEAPSDLDLSSFLSLESPPPEAPGDVDFLA
jgi:hypothetical protein